VGIKETLIGCVLDHYRVVEALGTGGMGEVYRAHDEQLDRDVALKVLPSESAGEEAIRDRLLHEARSASALNHPNICTIYQVGGSGPRPFIAMEYVVGRTLAQLTLGGSALPTEQALIFAIQIADALEHAHTRGVIHRDLKCANVIVTSEGRVKVLDFGLAKRMEGPELGAVTMSLASFTDARSIAGTLPYMAPEVLRGGAASTASDIWSFGVLLYEMITGTLPFEGQSAYDLTTSIMRDVPKPISNRLPRPLDNILHRCLSKEPDRRYRTAGEVRAALQAVAAGGYGSVTTTRARRAALLAGACLATALGFWAIELYPGHNRQFDSIAILPFANASPSTETEYLSDGLTDNLIDAASRLPNMRVASHASVFHYKGKQVDPRQVGRDMGVKAIITGAVAVNNGELAVDAEMVDTVTLGLLWKGHYARRLSNSVALEEDIARELIARLTGQVVAPPKKPEMQSNEAYQAHLKGEYHLNKNTPEELELARQYFEEAIAADPTYAAAYTGLANYYDTLADSGRAEPATTLLKSKAAAEKALQLDPKAAGPANNLAYFKLAYNWDFVGAEQDFRRLIAARPDDPNNYVQYAICLRTMGRSDDAIAASRRAVALDPLVVVFSGDLGWNYYYAHRFDQAIGQFRDTLVLDPGYAPAHFGLALSFHQKRAEAQAAAEFERYLEASGAKEDADNFKQIYRRSGYTVALDTLWRLQLKVLQEEAKDEYVSPMLFASTYALLGKKDQALEWLQKAYEERSMKLLDIRLDPDFDLVRTDPRFSLLVKRIGLP
jgi:eukaryotic-like serine/threonine-protein kinase